jgi:hypothetical protein
MHLKSFSNIMPVNVKKNLGDNNERTVIGMILSMIV